MQRLKRTFVEYDKLNFRKKVVFYQRKSDNLYFVYKASQYFNRKPDKEVYIFKSYWDAFRKYTELGGK